MLCWAVEGVALIIITGRSGIVAATLISPSCRYSIIIVSAISISHDAISLIVPDLVPNIKRLMTNLKTQQRLEKKKMGGRRIF